MRQLLFFISILVIFFTAKIIYGATSCNTDEINPRAEGLVSTSDINPASKFGTTSKGRCITNTSSAGGRVDIEKFTIPTYKNLKNQFYTRSAQNKKRVTQFDEITSDNRDGIYLVGSDSGMTLDTITFVNNSPGTKVVFIDQSLTITQDITYAPDGLVFVVAGDINIEKTVEKIDAVLIAYGTICTAFDSTFCPSQNILAEPLKINGSLISLKPYSESEEAIKFRRNLLDNNQPVEQINHQIKYLVILKDLFSEDLTITSESTSYGEDLGLKDLPEAP